MKSVRDAHTDPNGEPTTTIRLDNWRTHGAILREMFELPRPTQQITKITRDEPPPKIKILGATSPQARSFCGKRVARELVNAELYPRYTDGELRRQIRGTE